MPHQIVLIRHGQTAWSAEGKHTGRTDVPLTADGEQQARNLAPALAAYGRCPVVVSPLRRALDTASLAGLDDVTLDPDLMEWDYGGYEGMTTAQVREVAGPRWTVFEDGVIPGQTPGETLDQLAQRVRAVLSRTRPLLTHSDVVLVGHGHALRVLAASWIGAEPELAARLLLDPATISLLGEAHGLAGIAAWNSQVRS